MMENLFDEERAKMIVKNIHTIRQNVADAAIRSGRRPEDIQIMAVTKTVEPEYVNLAIQQGITLLGENRAQELLGKYEEYFVKKDNIHFIGHLQRNKVKSIIEKVSMIESVDSIELAEEISKQAEKRNIAMPVLIEVNIGYQESKSGVSPDRLYDLLKQISSLPAISVHGLMAIPPQENSRMYFEKMMQLYIDIKGQNIDNISMEYLSMGMSADYINAIECGANIVRIGSAMFGRRIYQ